MSRAKSVKIADPGAHFSNWHYAIEPHHYWTMGVDLRTFVIKKVPYQSYACSQPPDYNFCQGFVFYARSDPFHFLQIGAEQGVFEIEVFEGHLDHANGERFCWLITMDGLAQWLQTGERPDKCRRLDFSESKSGLMAWQIVKVDPIVTEPPDSVKHQ